MTAPRLSRYMKNAVFLVLKPIPNGYKYPCLERDSNPQTTVPMAAPYHSAIARHIGCECMEVVVFATFICAVIWFCVVLSF